MLERPHYLEQLLLSQLQAFLRDATPEALALLQRELVWVDLAGGQALMRQGEAGDAMYLLVSGRLRASIVGDDGRERRVREITRGQVVGEMSLFTDERRSATLVAVRDSVLVRLDKAAFRQLLSRSAELSIALTRQVIQRLQTEAGHSRLDRPVAIGLLPVSDGVGGAALAAFADGLAAELQAFGGVAVLDAARLEARLGEPGVCERSAHDAAAARRIAVCLDEVEASHGFVLLLADDGPTAWTACCSRHCDELLLLALADAPVALHATERQCLQQRPARTDAAEILLLLHPAARQAPQGTRDWLARRPLAGHLHLREGRRDDVARLARLLSRNGVGLVLAGGGARGAAHAGVYRALAERGVPVDAVGGTSMGAVFGAVIAADAAPAEVVDAFGGYFAENPTGDFSLLPMLSLIKGRRLRGMMERTELRFAGRRGLDLEDLWRSFFCVASNYSQAREQVLRSGPAVDAVMASCAIPGALPPVLHDGALLCDGGTFNNFPVDVMRAQWGIGRVIGVDLSLDAPRPIELDRLPGRWALLRDRLRPRRQRRYRLPSLTNYLMNVTSLYSTSRQREARQLTDLYLKPPLPKIGMLQWERFDTAVRLGYEHALQVLDAQAPSGAGSAGTAAPGAARP